MISLLGSRVIVVTEKVLRSKLDGEKKRAYTKMIEMTSRVIIMV